MQINEKELAEAVDALWEGDKAMGISCEDVYRKMMSDEVFALDLFSIIHQWGSYVAFEAKFCEVARNMLIEYLRLNNEIEAGLM